MWSWLRICRLARFEWQYECKASQNAAPSWLELGFGLRLGVGLANAAPSW